jgi:hypothetical protein
MGRDALFDLLAANLSCPKIGLHKNATYEQ